MTTNSKKAEIANQIKNAFDFIQKLYNESSYLIKEIEGQLAESEYRFQLLRTSGYAISSRSSSGLEQNNVNFWLLRRFAVAFVDDTSTEVIKGQNVTEINEKLKVLYFRVILDDINESEPQLVFGVFHNIQLIRDRKITKFENLMGHFEYAENKLFSQVPDIEYEDINFKLKGKFKKVNLLDINSSDELIEKVINPAIKIFEKVKNTIP
jgi:hypothetical protein